MKQLIIEAKTAYLDKVLIFVRNALSEDGWNTKEVFETELAVEEVFVNICRYAYKEPGGKAELYLEQTKEKAGMILRIADEGIPYDPLQRAEPDITLKAEEREAGGLGIFFVKQLMDEMMYQRIGGKNQLTLVKYRKEGSRDDSKDE